MFVIITYDVNEKRVNRVRKVLKKYITWCQNSVFEGEITEGKLTKCMAEVKKYLVDSEDSLYIYRIPYTKNIQKKVIGIEKNLDELFL
ncbi:CRISPR-associated endonuclease Cas2 [Clostridium beijerinckii]|uniref:CRISPR-associated endoribonuclease Cas2 n=1 Tax=Clostridium beijerinckii TaxID=1520 RepID=A0AAW3WFN6_CLOBE|nr:CRISPR-associated endonuclease Cas2 [Clostridium beijerinckii]MBC2459774.1 CRISPR-associated endonuclease Cas2 [Clostridium beijerinckii]MBC2477258.1 CRISPR-associated endonuclease Cas2 [Clostridium beijerinckii]NOV61052.1 CRISPR-associated protein Cas2 [Clostridium beijerinckii]NOW33085.1 CRISPR-associated protein Cas2 [Clostridium beijerinckii]